MTRPLILNLTVVAAALLAACAPTAAPAPPATSPPPIPATALPATDASTETQPETIPRPAPPESGPVVQPPDSGPIEEQGPTATPTPLPAPDGQSGVVGIVLIGPMCPVMREDQPCPDQPYQAVLTFLDERGKEVGRVQSDAAGHFQIALAPGTYTLHPEPGQGISYAGEQVVTVSAGQYAQVTVNYDSGIR